MADAEVSWFRGPRVRTDADGRFELPGGKKTRTSITVKHRRFLAPRLKVPTRSSGHEIKLEEGMSISGRGRGSG